MSLFGFCSHYETELELMIKKLDGKAGEFRAVESWELLFWFEPIKLHASIYALRGGLVRHFNVVLLT